MPGQPRYDELAPDPGGHEDWAGARTRSPASRAVELHPPFAETAAGDDDLVSLRDDPRFPPGA